MKVVVAEVVVVGVMVNADTDDSKDNEITAIENFILLFYWDGANGLEKEMKEFGN